MTSASTYLIDATGADPVLLPAEVYHYKQGGPAGPGYPNPGYPGGYPPGVGDEIGGVPGAGDGEGGFPVMSVNGGREGHCNHLNEGCDCFTDSFPPSRKVGLLNTKFPTQYKDRTVLQIVSHQVER